MANLKAIEVYSGNFLNHNLGVAIFKITNFRVAIIQLPLVTLVIRCEYNATWPTSILKLNI
jgi:hypothetical protein